MSTPVPTNPNPFVDPNNALRQFNQYFGDLRKQYGEDAIRQVGFTPKEFQDLQASLRKLQLDPRATPEQHREAYMQARDTLARRLTTPLEATRSYSEVPQPKPAPSPAPAVGNDGTMPPVVPMNVMSPDRKSPTQEQLYSYARAVGRGETGQWDPTLGTFVMTAQPPQPQQGGLTQAAPYDAAAAYRQNAQKLADAVRAGQITVERARQLQAPLFAATKLGGSPEGQAAMNAAAAQAQGGMPMSGYDAAAQYRNFGQELMGLIKSGALTVEQANALKAPVFNAVKLGNSNAGYQQMQAALAAARQQMGGQNIGGAVTPPMPQPDRHSEYGIPLWMQLGPGPERDAAYAQYMKAQSGGVQPKFIGQNFTGDAPPPGKKYIETPEGLVPVPINDVPVRPAMGPGLGTALGMPMPYNPVNTTTERDLRGPRGMGGMRNMFGVNPNDLAAMGGILPKLAEQFRNAEAMPSNWVSAPRTLTPEEQIAITSMPQRPQGVGMAPQLPNMVKPPQPMGVDNSTMIQTPNFRFGEAPQQMAPNAQAMALGGLMNKYHGGGC